MGDPQRSAHVLTLEHRNETSFGKRVFEDVILRRGYPGPPNRGLNTKTTPLISR